MFFFRYFFFSSKMEIPFRMIFSYLHEWICVDDFFITFAGLCSRILSHCKCLSITRLTCEITKRFYTITNIFFFFTFSKNHTWFVDFTSTPKFLQCSLRPSWNVQRFAFIQRLWWLICLRFFFHFLRLSISLPRFSDMRWCVLCSLCTMNTQWHFI